MQLSTANHNRAYPYKYLAVKGRHGWCVLALAIILTAVLWGFFFHSAVSSRKARVTASEESILALAHAVEQYCTYTFKTADVFLSSTELWLQSNKSKNPINDREFIGIIDNFRKHSDNLFDIRIASTQGQLYYFDGNSATPRDIVADREYFQAVIDKAPGIRHIGVPVISRVSGELRLPITSRMAQQHHGLEVINASLNLSKMLAAFEAERPKPNGSIGLWAIDGTLLVRAPQSPDLFGKTVATDPTDLAQLQQTKLESFISERSPVDSIQRLVARVGIANTPVTITVSIPMADVLAPWYREYFFALITILIATAVGLVSSVRLAKEFGVRDMHEAELERFATIDPLTNLNNRRHFLSLANNEFDRASRYEGALSVMMIDIDFFKKINDTWGHPVGDQVLQSLGEMLLTSVRDPDIVGRLGGEEFAIVLPQTDLAAARIIAERIRESVEGSLSAETKAGERIRITVSVGVTEFSRLDESFEECFSRVDNLLYKAKDSGRNRVESGQFPHGTHKSYPYHKEISLPVKVVNQWKI